MRFVGAALYVVVGLALAGALAWTFASEQRWLLSVVAGLLPVLGLGQWWSLRRRGGPAQAAADAMVWPFLFAVALLYSVAVG